MNSAIKARDTVKIAANKVSQRRLLVGLTLLIAALIAPFERFMTISGAKNGWSFSQLWLSVRDNYFSVDPLLYLFQGEKNGDAGWGLFIFAIILTFIGVIILVTSLFGIIATLKKAVLQRGYRIKSFNDIAYDLSEAVSKSRAKQKFQVWDLSLQGRSFAFAAHGDTILVSTELSAPLPHIVLDSKANEDSLSRSMNSGNEFIVDGVMYEHFRVFVAEKDPIKILEIFNPVLCDTLIKFGNFADIQIKGKSLAITFDASFLKKQQHPDEFFTGLVEITELFNEQAIKTDVSSSEIIPMNKPAKFMDTLLFRSYSPLVRVLYPLAIFITLAIVAPTVSVGENTFIGLSTLFGLLATWACASFMLRRIV